MANLAGIVKDYQNMILLFNQLFGYDILYKLNSNSYNLNKSIGNKHGAFKLEWTVDEIKQFIFDVQQQLIVSKKNTYDSLIFVISCHGQKNGVILDSNCKEYLLSNIFSRFNGPACPSFYYYTLYCYGYCILIINIKRCFFKNLYHCSSQHYQYTL